MAFRNTCCGIGRPSDRLRLPFLLAATAGFTLEWRWGNRRFWCRIDRPFVVACAAEVGSAAHAALDDVFGAGEADPLAFRTRGSVHGVAQDCWVLKATCPYAFEPARVSTTFSVSPNFLLLTFHLLLSAQAHLVPPTTNTAAPNPTSPPNMTSEG